MIRTLQRKVRKSRGFTLVELMIVVAIVGILAALAIYGVRKYMANAKSAEARNSLGQLAKDASSAYNRELMAATILGAGASTTVVNQLCGPAAAKVPTVLTSVASKKYQSTPAEWDAGSKTVGWQCLKFSMAEPQYYMYGYAATLVAAGEASTYTATAEGDLDGDAVGSKFTITGLVRGRQVVTSPTIDELLPDE